MASAHKAEQGRSILDVSVFLGTLLALAEQGKPKAKPHFVEIRVCKDTPLANQET